MVAAGCTFFTDNHDGLQRAALYWEAERDKVIEALRVEMEQLK